MWLRSVGWSTSDTIIWTDSYLAVVVHLNLTLLIEIEITVTCHNRRITCKRHGRDRKGNQMVIVAQIAPRSKRSFDFVVCIALRLDCMKQKRPKTTNLDIRLNESEKEGFELAAALAGISLSSWVRERLRLTAIRELEGAGRRVPFIPEIPIGGGGTSHA